MNAPTVRSLRVGIALGDHFIDERLFRTRDDITIGQSGKNTFAIPVEDLPRSWRLFTVCLGDDVTLHALAVHVDAARVEGGFLWRGSRAIRVDRVRVAPRTTAEFDLEVTTAEGETLRLLGRVWRTLTVPVQPERRLMAHLLGRPWRLRLDEGFTAYEGEGLAGHGMAERTRRL